MRLGLLGDIHGNAFALLAVLNAIKKSGVDALCLTGDFIGYYYSPDEVISMLSKMKAYAVRGNHEDMLMKCLKDSDADENYWLRYGSGVRFAKKLLNADALTYISGLPVRQMLEFNNKFILIAHGAPWDTNFYLYQDSDISLWQRAAEWNADYIILGHTHYQLSKKVGKTLFINPGSVGQPRNRRPGAAWALLDTETGWFEHYIEPYDVTKVMEQARLIDPHIPYLWEVLERQ